MSDTVRVRYAPSPTGIPHVGNIRTALFNWLFARHHKGVFILRIEDTDVARKVEKAVDGILESLKWLELDWDEGPYFQSQRLNIYQEVARRLVDGGHAYYCYCSQERLEKMRAEQVRQKEPPRYDRQCRDLSKEEQVRLQQVGITPVVRFKTPLEGQTRFYDLIRGDVVFENGTLDDFVLLKSDGFPTYHLANVTDDHLMNISHVMRADEWLSSTPRHVLLYNALGYEPPMFAHLPMILGPDRSKLSKRHGATSLLEYRDQGYLPEAVLNFLALLGWSLNDKTELMSRDDLIKHFSLERIGKTGAIFNIEKLSWMNGVYIRKLELGDLANRVMPFLERGLPAEVKRPPDRAYVLRVLPLVQDRLRTLGGAANLTEFFFVDDLNYDVTLLLGGGLSREQAIGALSASLEEMKVPPQFDKENLEKILRMLAEKLGLKTGPFFGLLRVATTGRTAAPPLFETMAVLGRERCFKRIERALSMLKAAQDKI